MELVKIYRLKGSKKCWKKFKQVEDSKKQKTPTKTPARRWVVFDLLCNCMI